VSSRFDIKREGLPNRWAFLLDGGLSIRTSDRSRKGSERMLAGFTPQAPRRGRGPPAECSQRE